MKCNLPGYYWRLKLGVSFNLTKNELFDLEEQTQCTFHDDANMEFWEIYIYI